ncbi:MAG: right-handed parallel beta-helix repeat-containing protein [Saprospiraceae bacterium]|nr:right-handed parallel beta-helix repeat-containing protein [Saprospiraceae bacterium]
MNKTVLTFLLSVLVAQVFLAQSIIYVSPTGSASVNGSDINQPTTLANAITLATTAGVTIYLRGGTYALSVTQSIASSRSGAAGNLKKLHAYPGDSRPVLDFSAMAFNSSNRGISLGASYWHIKGIDFYRAGDNGMFVSGSNNIIEFCSFYENYDTGLQIGNGAANNQVINCDSYYNADPTGENADGFAAKLDVGTGNSFKGCRAWQNSDDGWDGYLRPANDVSTTYENCWAFKNGYTKSGGTTTAGDGNGFKTGGSDAKDLSHNATLTRCLSFGNKADGFDQNSNLGNITLLNCTAFGNGRNYGMNDRALASGKLLTIKNCVSATGTQSILAAAVQATNSWTGGFTVTNADFVSIDPAAAENARQADGSLPNIMFMQLASGSDLINRGTDIGLPFNGSAPDLGCFETSEAIPVTLASFDGQKKDKGVLLSWKTESEQNNKGWTIQKRTLTTDKWMNIGFVKGNGTTSTPQYFSFLDIDESVNEVLYYRLQQEDFDGHLSLSRTISVSSESKKNESFICASNLVKEELRLIHPPFELPATFVITDITGHKWLSQSASVSNQTHIPVQHLPIGVYFVQLLRGSQSSVQKFIKQ